MNKKETNLIGQIIEVDNVAHHPNRLVERAKFIIPVATQSTYRYESLKVNITSKSRNSVCGIIGRAGAYGVKAFWAR